MTRKDVQGELAKSTSRRVPSFRGWDLRGADLSGLHLSRSDFRGADCTGVDFTGAQMLKVNFEGADLRGAVYSVEQFGLFCGVVPSAAGRQHVPNAVWEEVLPRDPEVRRRLVEFLEAGGEGPVSITCRRFEAPVRTREDVLDALGRGAPGVFLQWDLTGADLSGLDLRGSEFPGSVLLGADLRGADLTGAKLAFAVVHPRQLLDSRAVDYGELAGGGREALWDEVLPSDPDSRRLAEELLADWSGTIREALVAVEALRAA